MRKRKSRHFSGSKRQADKTDTVSLKHILAVPWILFGCVGALIEFALIWQEKKDLSECLISWEPNKN